MKCDQCEMLSDVDGYWDLWQEICNDAEIIDNEDGDLFMVAT